MLLNLNFFGSSRQIVLKFYIWQLSNVSILLGIKEIQKRLYYFHLSCILFDRFRIDAIYHKSKSSSLFNVYLQLPEAHNQQKKTFLKQLLSPKERIIIEDLP